MFPPPCHISRKSSWCLGTVPYIFSSQVPLPVRRMVINFPLYCRMTSCHISLFLALYVSKVDLSYVLCSHCTFSVPLIAFLVVQFPSPFMGKYSAPSCRVYFSHLVSLLFTSFYWKTLPKHLFMFHNLASYSYLTASFPCLKKMSTWYLLVAHMFGVLPKSSQR